MDKNLILSEAQKHVKNVQKKIQSTINKTLHSIKKGDEEYKSLPSADKFSHLSIMRAYKSLLEELQALHPTPYFVRCDVRFEGRTETQTIFFAKFHFNSSSIYSWISPASTMRFENPGEFSYTLPDGQNRSGILIRKDQFMIVDGKMMFLSTEKINQPRTLIHQEHFTRQKDDFALPEIVAQMEKAQDQVVRASHEKPFIISGPAGSGKTTLALHRIAYLAQSPDRAGFYDPKNMAIFVQNESAIDYFSKLLPSLGIHNCTITTFSLWAFKILNINEMTYVDRYGKNEEEKDLYEYAKLSALRNINLNTSPNSKLFSFLKNAYEPYFDANQKNIFQEQRKKRLLDRFDLTILLLKQKQIRGSLGTYKDREVEQKNGHIQWKKIYTPFQYALIAIDEFQNYLPEQIELFSSSVSKKYNSLIYIGEMAQQIKLGTIQNWDEIPFKPTPDRIITLQKVYRNTKEILEYIQKCGYAVQIPQEIKTGKPVIEKITKTPEEEISYIKDIIQRSPKRSIGILTQEKKYLNPFHRNFQSHPNVHVYSIENAQGIEFDIVILVGIQKKSSSECSKTPIPPEFLAEKKKIDRDILYVALTRAISELHVLGRNNPSEASYFN